MPRINIYNLDSINICVMIKMILKLLVAISQL